MTVTTVMSADIPARVSKLCREGGLQPAPSHAIELLMLATQTFSGLDGLVALECHPQGSDRIDLVVRLDHEGVRRLLDRGGQSPLHEHESRIALSFLTGWLNPAGPLAKIPFVELEYDLLDHVPAPWIGPAIDGNGRHRGHLDHASTRDTVFAVLDALAPGWRSTPLFTHLARMLDVLACHHGRVTHSTALTVRPNAPSPGVRAIVSVGRHCLLAFLRELAWPGDLTRVADEDRRLCAYQPVIDFDLDITESGPTPKMALYRGFLGPHASDEELRHVLASLHHRGLLTSERHAAAREWIACISGRSDRALSIKLGWSGDSEASVKLYFESIPEGSC